MTIESLLALVTAALLSLLVPPAGPDQGTVTYSGGLGESESTYTFAAELLNHADQNTTALMSAGKLQYTTGSIPNGIIIEPAIVLKLSNGAVFNSNFTDIEVTDATSGATIAIYKAGAGTSELSLDPVLLSALTSNMTINITSAGGTVQVPKGKFGSILEVGIGYSTDPSAADSGAALLIDSMVQYGGKVTTPFDAKIDAAQDFVLFTGPATTDTLGVTVTSEYANLNRPAGNADWEQVIYSDHNMSGYVVGVSSDYDTDTGNDFNVTSTTSGDQITTDTVLETTLTVEGVNEPIRTTEFTVGLTIDSTAIGTLELLSETTAAGAWEIFGYNGQIPNVSTSPEVDTTLVFTNRSAIAADVYFTIIDADGNSDVVDSVNDGIAAIGVSETKKYKMSDLLAKTSGLSGNAFAVEVTIPTTPSSVYGYASFKNLTLGQFKDLPIYNSSEMTY